VTVEELRTVHRAQPFRPFTIHMGDGRAFFVKHPDYVSHSPSGRTLIVYGEGDSFSILDLLLATKIEVPSSGKPGAAA
jgi:hypothetical protein